MLNHLNAGLVSAHGRIIHQKQQNYIGLTAKLDAMSPLKVLTRGYAMAETGEGKVLKSVKDIEIGDKMKITFNDGHVYATVSDKEEAK